MTRHASGDACNALKWALFLIVCGAMANVAVAWGCAAFAGRHESTAVVESATGEAPFVAHVMETATCTRVLAAAKVPETAAYRTGLIGAAEKSTRVDLLPSWATAILQSELARDSTANIMDLRATGWPARSMGLRFTSNMNFNWQLHGGLSLPAERISSGGFTIMRQHAVPLVPVWPGFAINTLLYATAIWLVFAIPLHGRKRLRIRRGQCAACGYPVGASNICTECGKMVNTNDVVPSSTIAS